jgi:hypothetical protein
MKKTQDTRQPQIFVKERRQAGIEKAIQKAAASRKAKADAEDALASAAAAAEAAKKEKAARLQADMTDELLEHFDISGFPCSEHYSKILGYPGCPVSNRVETACKNDYYKRLFFAT